MSKELRGSLAREPAHKADVSLRLAWGLKLDDELSFEG
jgi:hypothetical protein